MHADIERLSREYEAGEPREGRLARALRGDVPIWRQLGDEILGDLDEHVFGVGWWAPHLGTSRRILISDHLFACMRSVETNLTEARLHLMEAMDVWERENRFYARAVDRGADGRPRCQMPERRRPIDDVQLAMVMLHTVGVIRGIAGALDCFGASIVGVGAVGVGLQRADLSSARQALTRITGTAVGEQAQVALCNHVEAAIERAGPPGWLQWFTELRNTVIHRGPQVGNG